MREAKANRKIREGDESRQPDNQPAKRKGTIEGSALALQGSHIAPLRLGIRGSPLMRSFRENR